MAYTINPAKELLHAFSKRIASTMVGAWPPQRSRPAARYASAPRWARSRTLSTSRAGSRWA